MPKLECNRLVIGMSFTKITIVILYCLAYCDGKSYRNFTLLRGIPTSDKELGFFKNLSRVYGVTYWKRPALISKPVEFSVDPFNFKRIIKDAVANGVALTVIMKDIQSAFDKQTTKPYTRRKINTFDWRDFYRLNDIYNWLEDLQKVYPERMQLLSIGKSVENRDILGLRLILPGPGNRPKVIIEGGIHAREWISQAFVTYLIYELLNAPESTNVELRTIAHAYEWIIVPVLNPDGYEYTHEHDRMWRKNRQGIHGIDLNRNFNISFGSDNDDKDNMLGEEYCGEHEFSEPESVAMANFARANSEHLQYYMAFHSYGQYLLIPYAFDTSRVENYEEVSKIADHTASKISSKYGTVYTSGTAFETVGYVASGTSTDWVKKTLRVPYVITFELRDGGFFAFALPPELILPTCEETMDGVIAFLTPLPQDKQNIAPTHLSHGWRNHVQDEIIFTCIFFCFL